MAFPSGYHGPAEPNRLSDSLRKELTGSAHPVKLCYTVYAVTVTIPEKLRAELKRIGRQQNEPVSDLVRDSVRRYVAIEKSRALRKEVLPFAETQGLLRDEGVLKAIS